MAGRAAAQGKTGAVSGLVKDELGHPVPNVEVTVLKTSATVRTDTAGEFILSKIPAGNLDISFRRLAFEPVLLMMQVTANDTTEVEITLTVVAQKLTGVVVLADPEHRRILEAFESRRRQGIGHFITRYQIEQRHPMLLSDMLRMIPGTRLYSGENGRVSLRFARSGAANCPPQFFVDGIQAMGFTIDEMPPGDVEGVELYAGAAGLPPEYNRLHSTVNCGTVVIWTRIPGNEKAKP
ncbi:MAG: TonB family protein [Gemmatimonadetes bacterium]|nr:TonB family protein [Gemmatimonadota bacterium]